MSPAVAAAFRWGVAAYGGRRWCTATRRHGSLNWFVLLRLLHARLLSNERLFNYFLSKLQVVCLGL